MMRSLPHGARSGAQAAGLVILLFLAGCGKKNSVGDYDRMMQGRENAADALRSQGAKVEQKQYPLGQAWVVDLRGQTIDEDLLRQVKALGVVAELDLSKSTVTDDHLGLLTELGIPTMLVKFDLSSTGITDAGLDRLKYLAVLKELNLAGTKVTPAGVDRFKQKRQSDPSVRPFAKNPTIRLK
jgi:Leucine Rich repeat